MPFVPHAAAGGPHLVTCPQAPSRSRTKLSGKSADSTYAQPAFAARALRHTRVVERTVGLSPLAQPELEDVLEGLDLYRRFSSLGAFDVVLAATARRRGRPLASADRGFARASGLTHLNPASSGFLESVRTAA